MEDPLERLDPDEVDRVADELLDPELDLVTLGALLDPRLPEDLELVTDERPGFDLDFLTPAFLVERDSPEDLFREFEELYPEPELLPDDVRVL